jgi:kynureninase
VSLADARARDATDPLARFRDRFELPEGVIYLDGNSLGALPRVTAARLAEVVQHEWGRDLVGSWNAHDWIGAPRRVGDKIGQLIGAAPGEVIVADSTSVNAYKLLAAALAARPGRNVILSEPGNFPTDIYMVEGIRLLRPDTELRLVPPALLADALDESVAVLFLTHVHYKTAAMHDMAGLTARAQATGALAMWDLSHSAGAVTVDLNAAGADLAVGCGYKYLNGGPGAPAFLYVARRHQAAFNSPLTGWMGHTAPFDFVDDYRAAPGIERFLCGTPPILSLSALECGVDLLLEADRPALFAKGAALCDYFREQVTARTELALVSPADGARGSHVSLVHPNGYQVMQALIGRGVVGDFRAPDILRFGFTPLYTQFEDVWRAVDILSDVLRTECWRDPRYAVRGRVT